MPGSDCAGGKGLDKISGALHFIGIGGIGMSALAVLALARGMKVSGSDKSSSQITDELKALGAEIFVGHKAANIGKAEAIVVSTAINKENPELARARELGLSVYHRSEVLAYLASSKKLIAVSGTHGKTTTTGMIAQSLIDNDLDPSVVVGGIFDYLKSNAHAGSGELFVAEADESDRSHESLESEIAIVTNIEPDHMENYPGGFKQILESMASFANKARRFVLICTDDPGCRELRPLLSGKIVSYGTIEHSPEADYCFAPKTDSQIEIYKKGQLLGSLVLKIPGRHNKMNALAAIAIALELGIEFASAAASLSKFGGVARRFDIIGESRQICVVDDYAHHPTEVKATLEAAWQFKKTRRINAARQRIVAVFQPHQPGRLQNLWDEFANAFAQADLLVLSDIYVARGAQIEGISSERFAACVKHTDVHYLSGPVLELPEKLLPLLLAGDIVLTIGAGDITNLGKALLEAISKSEAIDGRSQ